MTLPLGIVSSGNGSGLQAVLDASAAGKLDVNVRVVVSNNSTSGALERARQARVPARHLSRATHPDPDALDDAITDALVSAGCELVLLAGYNWKIGPRTLGAFPDRVLNTHPAPLPRFGGRGMFGSAVHQAVLAAGIPASAASIHLVDEEYDRGPVVAEAPVPVLEGDTPDTLRERVVARERALIVETLAAIAAGNIDLRAIAASAR